jgi:hypothetical protein
VCAYTRNKPTKQTGGVHSKTMLSGQDEVLHRVTALVSEARQLSDKHLSVELEIRVGKFQTNGSFKPGYDNKHMSVMKRLITRLHETVAKYPDTWRYKGGTTYVRTFFGDNIRTTESKGLPTVTCCKRTVNRVNVYTSNREYDMRVTLAVETPQAATGSDHTHRQIVRRESFVETVHNVEGLEVCLQYDISKTSRDLEKPPYICDYHCEIEVLPGCYRRTTSSQELVDNQKIARLLVTRAMSLLGTHHIVQKEHVLLPIPSLSLAQSLS